MTIEPMVHQVRNESCWDYGGPDPDAEDWFYFDEPCPVFAPPPGRWMAECCPTGKGASDRGFYDDRYIVGSKRRFWRTHWRARVYLARHLADHHGVTLSPDRIMVHELAECPCLDETGGCGECEDGIRFLGPKAPSAVKS